MLEVTPTDCLFACPTCLANSEITIEYTYWDLVMVTCHGCYDYCSEEGSSGHSLIATGIANAVECWNLMCLEEAEDEGQMSYAHSNINLATLAEKKVVSDKLRASMKKWKEEKCSL